MARVVVVLALIGAVVGTICDGFHTWGDQTWYANPILLRAPLWVPALFAAASVGIGVGRLALDRMLGIAATSSLVTGLLALGYFIACYAFTGFVPFDEVRKAVAVLLLALIAWSIWDRGWSGFVFMLLVACIGTLFEQFLVAHSVFWYHDDLLRGVALWLPALYAVAAIGVGTFARSLHAAIRLGPDAAPAA